MTDPTNKLFTIQCKCGNCFPAEEGKCSCGNATGDLKLDVDQFLSRIYAAPDEDSSMDIVYNTFYHLHNRFDIMNDILIKIDVSKISPCMMCAFLTQTFKYIKQVPNHLIFLANCENRLREMNFSEKRIKNIFEGLRETGNYWKDMEYFGAPTVIMGPKPE